MYFEITIDADNGIEMFAQVDADVKMAIEDGVKAKKAGKA